MSWAGKTVLVTGAAGFIGSHLCERLVDLGATVRAFVKYNSRNDWGLLELAPRAKLDSLNVISGDLKDCDAVRDAVQGAETVFHLGSLISIPYSYVHPRDAVDTNIQAVLNVLSAARSAGVSRIVHTSTSEVYGTARYVPIDENHPLQGQSPYSASKIGADMIAESFYRAYGLPVATIRPFNTYGPRQSARAVIPTIVTQALSGDKVVLGSLQPTRDLTFVDDTVDGFLKMAESAEAVGAVINVGSGFEISIGDLADKVLSLMGKKAEIVCSRERLRPAGSEVERLWCDNRRARKLLGWEPRHSLEDGLKKTIEWIGTHLDLYKPNIYNI
ncbi:MAG: GDP-mannose 4,6-dehydratase [Chloroflexi bacterium]|nr:GDP-mannose 4,6-dehydratase [Chloroflexota bacterium]